MTGLDGRITAVIFLTSPVDALHVSMFLPCQEVAIVMEDANFLNGTVLIMIVYRDTSRNGVKPYRPEPERSMRR